MYYLIMENIFKNKLKMKKISKKSRNIRSGMLNILRIMLTIAISPNLYPNRTRALLEHNFEVKILK